MRKHGTALWQAIVFFGLLGGLSLHAQGWDELRGLKAGDTIKVQDTGGHESKGTFRAVTVDNISLESGTGTTVVERAKVRKVQVRSQSRRLRNAIIGGAIGVAVAVTLDQTLGTRLRNEGGDGGRALTYVGSVGLFGGLAAALPGYRTIYRVR